MPTDNLNLWGTLMSDKYEGLRRAAEELVTAMETCHECKGLLVLQEDPAHCEDCSYECESHGGPTCTPIYVLHARLKSLLQEREQLLAREQSRSREVLGKGEIR